MKEIEINLYQMYDQTIEDFQEYEGEVKIIQKNKKDKHFFNASIIKKGIIQEFITIIDNDEHKKINYTYFDISNMRYYSDTHFLTITLK